jgi:hypothetical protein
MYEPWITSFDKGDGSEMTVWSGGDDLVLKKWDLEQNFRPSLVNKQYVTCGECGLRLTWSDSMLASQLSHSVHISHI